MKNIISVIDSYEEFCEKFIIPIIKTGKCLVNENEIINVLLKYRKEIIQNKIRLFFQSINLKNEEEKIQFVKKLKSNEKIIFFESINKIIDLDDNLQIYVMSYLTQKYIENADLNYYEKKLFYNINTLSEDDFEIFFGIYKSYIEKTNQNNIVFEENEKKYENEEIIKISLFKFSDLGLLIYKDKIEEDGDYARRSFLGMPHYGEMKLSKIIFYEKSNYSDNLFNLLKNYNDINDGIIESKSNKILKIN